MTTNPSRYIPINCDFHDLLESLATTRKRVQIGFHDAEGEVQHRTAIITDVFARKEAEYLSMSTGETLRLDWLLNVDGTNFSDYCAQACSHGDVPLTRKST